MCVFFLFLFFFVCVCVCVCVCVSPTRERKDKYTGNTTALPAAKVAVFGRQILEVGVRRVWQ